MSNRMYLAVGAAALLAAVSAPLSSVDAGVTLNLSSPINLGSQGGEPRIVADGLGGVYVSAPTGLGNGVVQRINGTNLWTSRNHAASFPSRQNIGSFQGGGDSDISIAPDDGTVYVADLNAVSATVCASTDGGNTFHGANVAGAPDVFGCREVQTSQYGPSNDRQWLTAGKNGVVYFTYHEFNSAQPLILRDNNHGKDGFTDGPCGPIVSNPLIEANVLDDLNAGALVSKPVIDSAGNLYILFITPTPQELADANASGQTSATWSQAYLAISTDGCKSFTDHVIYDGVAAHGFNTVQLADIFTQLARDGAGNLYAVAAGFVGNTRFDTAANVYLFSSTDGGSTWSAPQMLDSAASHHALPAIAAGSSAGQVAVGYFRSLSGSVGSNGFSGTWTYTVAESNNANTGAPTWTYADPSSGHVYHNGDICNAGLICGTPLPGVGSDRDLADFSSATIDSDNCPIFSFPGDASFSGSGLANAYVTKQSTPCF